MIRCIWQNDITLSPGFGHALEGHVAATNGINLTKTWEFHTPQSLLASIQHRDAACSFSPLQQFVRILHSRFKDFSVRRVLRSSCPVCILESPATASSVSSSALWRVFSGLTICDSSLKLRAEILAVPLRNPSSSTFPFCLPR